MQQLAHNSAPRGYLIRSRPARGAVKSRLPAPQASYALQLSGRQLRMSAVKKGTVDWEAEAEALAAQETAKLPSGPEDEARFLKETTQAIRRLGREGDAVGVSTAAFRPHRSCAQAL